MTNGRDRDRRQPVGFREYDEKIPSNLTAEQILIRSGNIGSVRIGQKVGEDKFRLFLSKLGVLNEINFDIANLGEPLQLPVHEEFPPAPDISHLALVTVGLNDQGDT